MEAQEPEIELTVSIGTLEPRLRPQQRRLTLASIPFHPTADKTMHPAGNPLVAGAAPAGSAFRRLGRLNHQRRVGGQRWRSAEGYASGVEAWWVGNRNNVTERTVGWALLGDFEGPIWGSKFPGI